MSRIRALYPTSFLQNFRSQIGRSSDYSLSELGFADESGVAEIAEFRLREIRVGTREEDILWLQIAMGNVFGVKKFNRRPLFPYSMADLVH